MLREEYKELHGPTGQLPKADGLAALYEAIHSLTEKRSALCLSGGGIRSATFGLGVMQGLARVLPHFHYLSTVSGGGYIGGWLTAWLHHSGNNVGSVTGQLAKLDPKNKLNPEPSPISQLRDYSNYLAPRPGLLSADTWTLVGTILRNLLLVWIVLVPLLGAGLIMPRLYLALIQTRPEPAHATALGRYLLLGLGATALAWAVAYIGASIPSSTTARRSQGQFLALCLLPLLISVLCLTLSRWTDDDDREWWARGGSWMLIAGVVWTVLNSLVLFGPFVFSKAVVGALVASVGGVSGLIAVVGGWSARSAAGSKLPAAPGLSSTLSRLGLPAAAAVFTAVLLIAMSLLTSGLLCVLMNSMPASAGGWGIRARPATTPSISRAPVSPSAPSWPKPLA